MMTPIESLMAMSSIFWWKQDLKLNAYVVQAKKASWNAFWKRTKWIRKRISCGRPNQKRSSRGWTTGTPFITWPLSWIVNPIFVMITWSFVPTNRIILHYIKRKTNVEWTVKQVVFKNKWWSMEKRLQLRRWKAAIDMNTTHAYWLGWTEQQIATSLG